MHKINKKRHVKIVIVLLMLLTALSIVSVLAEDSDIWNSEYYDYDKYSYNEINKLFDETPNSKAAEMSSSVMEQQQIILMLKSQ